MRGHLGGPARSGRFPGLVLAAATALMGGCGGGTAPSDPVRENPEFKAAVSKSAEAYRSRMQKGAQAKRPPSAPSKGR
jgi:hypothetical protein